METTLQTDHIERVSLINKFSRKIEDEFESARSGSYRKMLENYCNAYSESYLYSDPVPVARIESNIAYFLFTAFSWRASIEGDRYWREIHNTFIRGQRG